MKIFSKPTSRIEPLETRIAPAALVNGANILGTGHDGSGYTSIGENSVTLVQVLSGQAIVWFDAANQHITGISVGDGTKLDITGDVFGDVVANLTKDGHLTDADHNSANGYDGGILLANDVLGIATHQLGSQSGDIGRIITGGAVSNVAIHGNLSGIYAGDGVYRAGSTAVQGSGSALSVAVSIGLDVNVVQSGEQAGFSLLRADAVFESGASIKNATIQTGATLQIFAGDGAAPGKSGGSVKNVTITSAFSSDPSLPSYSIYGGDGANGSIGGQGGSVSDVTETNASGLVLINAGRGGNGSAGAGGSGGALSNINGQSDSANYEIHAGDGGSGTKGGGGGGSLKNNNFSSQAPGTNLLGKGDFVGNGSGGDGLEDLLVIDTSTGQMLLEKNTGTGFSVVAQLSGTFIDTQGSTPDSVAVADLNGDGSLDFVVSYKNSSNIGIFLNDGQGVFTGQSLDTNGGPVFVAAGNFAGDNNADIAVLTSDASSTNAFIFQGTGGGNFTPLAVSTQIAMGDATALQTLTFGNGTKALAIGFASGEVETLVPTGSNSAPFNVIDNGKLATGAVTSLDADTGTKELLVFSVQAASLGVYNYAASGAITPISIIDITGLTNPLVKAQFADAGNTVPSVGVLSSGNSFAQVDVFGFDPVAATWSDTNTLSSSSGLKDFIALKTTAESDLVALGGTLSKFFYSSSLGGFQSASAPFLGKSVAVTAGEGGDATAKGAGGAGGSVINFHSDASTLGITAGSGGEGATGSGGKGGSISNAATFTIGKEEFTSVLTALDAVSVAAGDGGSSTAAGGGAGGSVSGVNITSEGGDISVFSGAGGVGGGANGGAGGQITGLETLSGFSDATSDIGVTVSLGAGGAATGATGNGGAGGSLSGLQQSLVISADQETNEQDFVVNISGGNGGSSAHGAGGAGGALTKLVLSEDPANSDTQADSSVYLILTGGSGGNGAKGGAGGAVTNVQETSTFDEVSEQGQITINYLGLEALGGNGGSGAASKGGAGGSVSGLKVSGLTSYDIDAGAADQPGLIAVAGAGGASATIGGAGGSVSKIESSNAPGPNNTNVAVTELAGAVLMAGDGGSGDAKGGAGGSVSAFSVGVQAVVYTSEMNPAITLAIGGSIDVQSGDGGASASGLGGAGGAINKGQIASIGGDANATVDSSILTKYDGGAVIGYSLLVATGSGGAGATLGGAGGSMSGISISTPQSNADYSTYGALFVAGHGGDATASGKGGSGGSIAEIKQGQDVNSAISLIQAGNGGGGLGLTSSGGHGGSVSGVKTVGFIGKPSDNSVGLGAFDQGLVQGVFSGRGGLGSIAGMAGNVTDVTAQQIAAIAAAITPGGTFGVAGKVSGIKAGVIGYDVNGDSTFGSGSGGSFSPALSVDTSMDGFILATLTSQISTDDNTRTTAFTFHS